MLPFYVRAGKKVFYYKIHIRIIQKTASSKYTILEAAQHRNIDITENKRVINIMNLPVT
jgi:hypothetical protein